MFSLPSGKFSGECYALLVLSNFFFNGGPDLRQTSSQLLLLAAITLLTLAPNVVAQSAAASLAALPEADVLIYVSPQRILNEAAPRVMPPAEITKMRAAFADIKKGVGIDPSTLEYLVIAVRFHKPASDLSFVAPDVMAVVGGDFSSDSLMTLGQLYLQDKVRVEKHGSKSISLMKIDPIAAQAAKESDTQTICRNWRGAVECKLSRDRQSALSQIRH